jgi:hypothetical protein
MPKAELDKQGKLFWHYAKLAGWDNTRINALLVKKYAATHWNVLTAEQRRSAINVMKAYAEKGRGAANKRLRSAIMSIVAQNGRTKDWLYETMNVAPEHTLTKMDFPELSEMLKSVQAMFPKQHKTNKKEEKR